MTGGKWWRRLLHGQSHGELIQFLIKDVYTLGIQ